MNQYVKKYQTTQIQTASQEAILVMLHDGAIQYLNKAKISIERKDVQNTHDNLIKTQEIFNEFINTINPEPNPELARHLTLLYRFLIAQCIEANMKQTTEPIDIVLGYVKDLKSTWEQAVFKSRKLEKEAGYDEEQEETSYDA